MASIMIRVWCLGDDGIDVPCTRRQFKNTSDARKYMRGIASNRKPHIEIEDNNGAEFWREPTWK
jgi:hypothetical protein